MRHNLSETTELLRDRRSISPERYSPQGSQGNREQVLTNATWAPPTVHDPAWRFKAYVGEGMKRIGPKLAEWYVSMPASKHRRARWPSWRREANGVRWLCWDWNRIPTDASHHDERMAVACAAQNMYLTCTAHGIGGFWSTPKFLQLPEVKAFVGLPENGEVLGIFYMGYPEDGAWPKSHRKPLEYVTDWNE